TIITLVKSTNLPTDYKISLPYYWPHTATHVRSQSSERIPSRGPDNGCRTDRHIDAPLSAPKDKASRSAIEASIKNFADPMSVRSLPLGALTRRECVIVIFGCVVG